MTSFAAIGDDFHQALTVAKEDNAAKTKPLVGALAALNLEHERSMQMLKAAHVRTLSAARDLSVKNYEEAIARYGEESSEYLTEALRVADIWAESRWAKAKRFGIWLFGGAPRP